MLHSIQSSPFPYTRALNLRLDSSLVHSTWVRESCIFEIGHMITAVSSESKCSEQRSRFHHLPLPHARASQGFLGLGCNPQVRYLSTLLILGTRSSFRTTSLMRLLEGSIQGVRTECPASMSLGGIGQRNAEVPCWNVHCELSTTLGAPLVCFLSSTMPPQYGFRTRDLPSRDRFQTRS
jgi:hypothetical protein